MTTPASGGCTSDGSVPWNPTRLVPEAGDAAAQASAHHSEATVVNVNQDVSTIGAPDAASGLVTQRSNIANTPGARPFTGE